MIARMPEFGRSCVASALASGPSDAPVSISVWDRPSPSGEGDHEDAVGLADPEVALLPLFQDRLRTRQAAVAERDDGRFDGPARAFDDGVAVGLHQGLERALRRLLRRGECRGEKREGKGHQGGEGREPGSHHARLGREGKVRGPARPPPGEISSWT